MRQFEKWKGKKAEFLSENKDKVPEHKSPSPAGEIFNSYDEGSVILGNKSTKKQTTINGQSNYGQVCEVLKNSTNVINQQAEGTAKDLLAKLTAEVDALIKALPADKEEVKKEAADNLRLLVDAATTDKPKRKWYLVSADGLIEAAKFSQELSGNIADTIGQLSKHFWP